MQEQHSRIFLSFEGQNVTTSSYFNMKTIYQRYIKLLCCSCKVLYQKHLGLSILPNTLWYSGNRVFLPHPIFCVTVLILNTNTVSYFSCFEKLFPRSMKWNLFSENDYKTLTNLKYVYLNFMTICLLLKLWKQRLVSYNEMSHFPVIKHETSSSKIVRKNYYCGDIFHICSEI